MGQVSVGSLTVAGVNVPIAGGPWVLGPGTLSPWTPPPFVRPTGQSPLGVPYVPIESLGFGPGADPNAIVAYQIAHAITGVLTAPPGVYPVRDFGKGDLTSFYIPHGPSLGTNGYCWGFVGSGRSSLDRSASGTIIELQANTNTKGNGNRLAMMRAGDNAQLEIGGLRLCGLDQGGQDFSGIQLVNQQQACLLHDLTVDGCKGSANVPTATGGETTGVAIIDKLDGVRRDHLLNWVEVDGRRADGKRYGAAPMGGQNMNGSIWNDCYGHDGVASSIGWSVSRNVTTNRIRSERNGSGSGTLSGGGLNHENTTGIVHNDPLLLLDRSNGNTGVHISHSNYNGNGHNASEFAPGLLTINRPIALDAFGNGVFEEMAFPTSLMAYTLQPVNGAGSVQLGAMTPDGHPLAIAWQHP